MITTIGEIVRGDREVFPPFLYDAYRSTIRRAPRMPLVEVPLTLSELTGPGPAISAVTPEDADLTTNAGTGGEAIGQRIIVSEFRVTWVTWSGVILVAALTLLAIAFVQSDNRLAAALAMGLFASAVASALILIAAHDRPFTGDARVRPDVLLQVDPGAP